MNKEVEILVVGTGPAGLSAAIEAARYGAQVLVVDENSKPGGQLFKQIHKFFGSRRHHAGVRGVDIGTELLAEVEALGVEVMLNTVAYGVYPHDEGVALAVNGETGMIVHPKKIIMATGASENPLAFPGWTLPGVVGAIIARVDEKFKPIPGTEQFIEADCIGIAVGLTPDISLPSMARVTFTNGGRLGAQVPLHDRDMMTTQAGIYVAGDASGVEEASSAIEEGKLAGIAAAEALGKLDAAAAAEAKNKVWESLNQLRTGPFGAGRANAKEEIIKKMDEWKVDHNAV